MSIYATIAHIGIRRFGDQSFVDILIQSVPPHIDHTGPDWDFLPPPVDPDGSVMRAVLFVEPGDEKGTTRNGQEYVKPLLVLSGQDYLTTPFAKLLRTLEESLDRRYGPRPAAILLSPDGTRTIFPTD